MTKPLYAYEKKTNRFRNAQTGRFISPAQMDTLRETYLAQEQAINDALARRLFNKEITLDAWLTEFKGNLNRVYTTQYMLAKGGKAQMSFSDYGALGAQLKKQYGFADGFAQKLANGGFSEGQVQQAIDRMNRYLPASNLMYNQGKLAAVYPGLALPAQIGEKCECSYGCRCEWRVEEHADRWLAYWELGEAEHCPTCLWRNANWYPFVQMKVSR